MSSLIIVSGVLVSVLIASLLNLLSPAKLFMIGAATLMLSGVLSTQQALGGFANAGIFTIAALYVVVAGLRESGATLLIRRYLVGQPSSPGQLVNRILPVTSMLSAVVNNTPVVAMFTSLTQSMSKRFNIQLSHVLLPISYASILGGLCTLIGTSTNLVVDDLMRDALGHGFSLFELSWVGVPLTILGLVYLKYATPLLMPQRHGTREQFEETREYLVEMQVAGNSELVGKDLKSAGLRNLPGLFLVEIIRNEHPITAIDTNTMIEAHDLLVFAGNPDSVFELQNIHGLSLSNQQRFKLNAHHTERRLFEVVLSQSNPMVGSTLKKSRFRHQYNAVVLSISRQGQRLSGKPGELELQAGDTLLIEAQKGFLFRYRYSRDFLLVSKLNNGLQVDSSKAGVTLGIFVTMIVASGSGVLPIFHSALLAAAAMLVCRCISFEDAGKSIDYQVLIVIACAFALGQGVQVSGLAETLSGGLLQYATTPLLALVAIYFSTQLLTEMITNNAAAIIMFPVALSTASSLDTNVAPFAVAVMVAASASFITPTGYQTNLMVMGPGGYKYLDYVKLGLPLSTLVAIVSLTLIPMVWGF
ncbi:SLC13 family permease [Shewanella corallii]|uniref:SLC13 family permease n=1 Tax=Shewanella corallii TaxID=560080 RepID=A0ABT0N8H2_9GAMM|nr:SLC13 family permease [Shewanella corallii]MCL2914161.1 SLC13 family permease [Shewanella corallii]